MTDLRQWPRERRLAGRRFTAWVCFGLLRLLHQLSHLLPVIKVPRWVKLAGDIDNRTWAPAVEIADPRFGRSMSLPSIMEVRIDGRAGTVEPTELEPVARRLFPAYPAFSVNVAFSCGRSRRIRPGVYADPRSPWFNVFVGYYQIDAPRSGWDRPFGYRPDGPAGSPWTSGSLPSWAGPTGTTSPTTCTASRSRRSRPLIRGGCRQPRWDER